MKLKKRKIKYAAIFFICWFAFLVILVDGVLKFQTLVDYFGSYALVELSLLLLVIITTVAVYKLTKENSNSNTWRSDWWSGFRSVEAYEALAADGQRLAGAIIVIKADEHRGELAFLYVKVGVQSKGIGQTICTSRSFEGRVHDAGQLEMFISNYAAHCAQKRFVLSVR